jgi:transcriptional regulator with XRE-family HTH domain
MATTGGFQAPRRYRRSERYTKFLKRLKQAREEAGLTQTDAGKRLGVPASFISKSERGERRVDALEFSDFARIYGKPFAYFFR